MGGETLDAVLTAVLAPLGIALSILVVHLIAVLWRVTALRRPLPVVVHPLRFEHSRPDFVGGQPDALLELPSRLRSYLGGDVGSQVELAPGPGGPLTNQFAAAAPHRGDTTWVGHLTRTLLSRYRPTLNIVLVPEVPERGLSVGVQIVKEPHGEVVAARSITAPDLLELYHVIGGFCAEAVLEQPRLLSRTPRWGHWRNNAYTQLRIGLSREREGDAAARRGDKAAADREYTLAHEKYSEAARRCPGNSRIALAHGNLHEKREEFDEAANVYHAAACLWPQNVDLSYRLAAASVNHAEPDLDKRAKRLRAANRSLAYAKDRLRSAVVLKALLRTYVPRRRDKGERAFWRSWFRPDRYRRSLRLLRKSRRYEYCCALEIAIEGNKLLLWRLQHGAGELTDRETTRAVTQSWRKVVRITSKKRIGWLAHWTAACYFSRLTQLTDGCTPPAGEWLRDRKSLTSPGSSSGLGIAVDGAEVAWKTYCEERAVGELGRVVRNPCSQFDARLLQTDPDMMPLQEALKGRAVAVLAGVVPTPHDGEVAVPAPRRAIGRSPSAAGPLPRSHGRHR
jgi:tetratricopeptide (TPR) repeat protein